MMICLSFLPAVLTLNDHVIRTDDPEKAVTMTIARVDWCVLKDA